MAEVCSMAVSRMRISIFSKDSDYQVRVSGYSSKEEKLLRGRLNIFPGVEALERMIEYTDLRADEYFVHKGKNGPEICFACEYGRLARLRELTDQLKITPAQGDDLVPDSAEAKKMLAREDQFQKEMDHLIKAAMPFYKQGLRALVLGSLLRIGIMIVLLVVFRGVWLVKGDHYQTRSLQAIMASAETPYETQDFISYFLKPVYTHRSKLMIKRPLFIRGGNVILDGGHYIKIDGIGNLKASIEAHNNAPVMIKVDARSGEMRVTGVFVGQDLISPKGKLNYLGRKPVTAKPPMRVDALDTEARGAYVRIRSADPEEEATFAWMLGQTISITARVSQSGDFFFIGSEDFKFAVSKNTVKQEILEMLETAAMNNERAIFDMRLKSKPWPLRNRRNPNLERKSTGVICEGGLHFVTLQSAVLKNL
jgi:hypothetical protein